MTIGLASVAAPKPFVENFEIATELKYQLIDERPQNEKTPSRGSSNRQSCDYSIWRIGEDEVVPSRIDYLKSRLQRELKAESLNGATVKIKEFSVYFNQQLSARSALSGIKLNPGASSKIEDVLKLLLQSFECWAGPGTPGGYDLSTNPAAQPAAVVTIRLEIGAQPFQSHYAFIPSKEEQGLPIGGTALIRAVDKLVENINGAK